MCVRVCSSLNAHNLDNVAFLTCIWMLALGLLPCTRVNSFRRYPLAAASPGAPHVRPNSPADRGILVKAPRKMKKNTVSLFRSSCSWAQVCKGVTFVVSKEASPPNLVLKSAGPFCRYVSRVLVHDLATNRKWYFLCNSWLSIDVGDCVLDKEFPVATEQDRKQFRYFLLFKQTLFTLFFHL